MKRIKIINFKWWWIYLVIIFLSFFVYSNFSYLENFCKNWKEYFFIDSLKNKKIIEFLNLSGSKFNKLQLSFQDEINLLVLSKNLSQAEKKYFQYTTFSYKDYFNIWNIFLLKWYFNFGKTWFINNFTKSLVYYDISLKNSPSYVSKEKILFNQNLASSVLKFSYLYFCDNLFLSMIKNINNLLNKIDNLIVVLKKQMEVLNKWNYYKDLSKCIIQLKADANKNIYLAYENKKFFLNTKRWIFYKLLKYNWNEFDCYQKRNYFISKYKDSIESSLKYFDKFYTLQNNLLKVYSGATYFQMKLLCENRSKLAKKMSKENKKMEKNYKNLSDLANTPKPQRKHKKPNKESSTNKSNWDQKTLDKSWNNVNYDKQFQEYTKSVLESLKKKNKDIINQIMKEKSQDIFNPMMYIKNLFKKFNWKKDYYLNKKEQTNWK